MAAISTFPSKLRRFTHAEPAGFRHHHDQA
jgi:hypothetical protein